MRLAANLARSTDQCDRTGVAARLDQTGTFFDGTPIYSPDWAPWAIPPTTPSNALLEAEIWHADGIPGLKFSTTISDVIEKSDFVTTSTTPVDGDLLRYPGGLKTVTDAQRNEIARRVCEAGGTVAPLTRRWVLPFRMQIMQVTSDPNVNGDQLLALLPAAIRAHAQWDGMYVTYLGPPIDGVALEAMATTIYNTFRIPNPTTEVEKYRGRVDLGLTPGTPVAP